jgi:hypothetical protein
MAAEKGLRRWISSILGDASNEVRISEITDFVMQRWEYNSEPDCGYDSDWGLHLEEDDSIDSWDGDSSTVSCPRFCGYEVNEGLAEVVWKMAEDAQDEHESAIRFYGLDSRASKPVICHCKTLRGTAKSPAETAPTDRYLMLVRDPPRWDSVYGPDASPPRRVRPATKPSLSDSSSLNPNHSSMQAKQSTRELLSMVTQRKGLLTTATSPSIVSTPIVSRNPFRKDFSNGPARGGLSPHRRPGDSAQDGSSDSVPDGPTPKRMKSISQLPIPPKPTPPGATLQSQRAKSSVGPGIVLKKIGKLKQTTLSGVFGKRT